MKTTATILACIAAISSLTGCISYRLVDRTESASTYALYSMDHEIPEDLRNEVQASCGGPAKVVHEGEVPIGETTQTSTQATHRRGVTFGTSQTDTTQKTEWRVTFQCNGGGDGAQPPVADSAQAAAQ
jgi:hypothetical protein